MASLTSHGMLSPDPLVLGVGEARVFCSCTSSNADPNICASSLGEGSFVVSMPSHMGFVVTFKAHTCTGKANRNCVKLSLQRIGASSLDGQDCVCCEFRTADTVCHSSPASGSHQNIFLVAPFKALKKEKHFQIIYFLLHFPFDLHHCKRGCPGGELGVGCRRMAVLTYIGA